MEDLKRYIHRHFEQIFVLVILSVTATINYFIPQKLAFLNFYFLPVILGAYYLGRRMAVLGAVFCLLMVAGYVYLFPESFYDDGTELSIATHVAIWGGFLIIAGAVVGRLSERLGERIHVMSTMNSELEAHQAKLATAHNALKDHTENLELRVRERTVELERSRNAMENMKQKVETALYATMDPTVVNLMIEGQLRNEKRDVSILFSDLVNFTSYSEKHPPEEVISELNRYLRDVEPIIQTYRGHIDKYMGDGIMCEFGAPINYVTHRTMAVMAGLKLQEQLSRLSYPWQMRVGIASGQVFTGLIGFRRQTYTAIGDVVNLAARLEKACTPGSVLIDKHTYDGVIDFIEARRLRQFSAAHDPEDVRLELELEALLEQLEQNQDDADLHYRVASLHLALHEPAHAMEHLEAALKLQPTSTPFKVAYAEAGLQLKDQERISVKGRRQRVEVYEAIGLRDPLRDPRKIPATFYADYRGVGDLIKIPNDIILPVEAMDNSIGHSRVVAVLSYALAGLLDIGEPDRTHIMNAAFLADIGKEIVPHHILNRGDNVSPSEFEFIKQHPLESRRALRKLGYENPLMEQIVTHVHERYNGSGYPHGLSGAAIPLGARIVAVADAYDSLTSRRPYRDPWARAAALQEIQRETENGLYDPHVVALLMKLLGNDA